MHAWQMRREGQALTQRNTNLTANVWKTYSDLFQKARTLDK
jgi:hypothetical protein